MTSSPVSQCTALCFMLAVTFAVVYDVYKKALEGQVLCTYALQKVHL